MNYNLDLSEAQKVVEGRSSLENAIRQAQEVQAAIAKNNDDGATSPSITNGGRVWTSAKIQT